MNPIAKGLPVHTVELSRFRPIPPLQNHGYGQDPANLIAIRAPAAQTVQLRRRIVPPRNFQGCAHSISPLSESPHRIERAHLWEAL